MKNAIRDSLNAVQKAVGRIKYYMQYNIYTVAKWRWTKIHQAKRDGEVLLLWPGVGHESWPEQATLAPHGDHDYISPTPTVLCGPIRWESCTSSYWLHHQRKEYKLPLNARKPSMQSWLEGHRSSVSRTSIEGRRSNMREIDKKTWWRGWRGRRGREGRTEAHRETSQPLLRHQETF